MQSEAWLTTRDGTVLGALIIRTERAATASGAHLGLSKLYR